MKYFVFILTLLAPALSYCESFLLCGNNENARKLAQLIYQSNEQQRKYLVCDPLLTQLAQEKAKEMARFSQVSHTITVGANQRLFEGGFELPRFYPLFSANSVEAIQGGKATAEDTFIAFMMSKPHRRHVMGEHPFYLGQSHMGVAYVRDDASAHVDYWVVYIAHHKAIQPLPNARLIAKK